MTDTYVKVLFPNYGTSAKTVNLTSYEQYPPGGFGDQKVFDNARHTTLEPGTEIVLAVKLPTCMYQIDAYVGDTVTRPPHEPGLLLGFVYNRNLAMCGGSKCALVSGALTKDGEQLTDASVKGTLVISLAGSSVSGSLMFRGTTTIVNNSQRIPYEFVRPPYGSSSLSYKAELKVMVGQENCNTVTVEVVVPPLPKPPEYLGCSHGYWKNHVSSWPSPYQPSTLVSSVFSAAPQGMTFMEALEYGGGDKGKILLRNAVGAVLNAAHQRVGYPLTLSQLQQLVNATLLGTDQAKTALNEELDKYNNLGCPL
jgi:hypothetical protein